jgi:hypothetical protein
MNGCTGHRTPKRTDQVERFMDVVRYFLSGFHIRPKGVKKPYNPVLGEFYRARWDFEDGTHAYYISEQVSHHPPGSVYAYVNPSKELRIDGHIEPKAKFFGNSAG